MAQFFLMLPIFIVVFFIEWGFVHWILRREMTTSFWVTLVLSVSTLLVAGLFFFFFEIVTFSTQDFVAKFSMGMEGLSNLFWLVIGIWCASFLVDFFILKGLCVSFLPPPPPNQMRMVLGLMWGNFFSSPLLALVVWLLQFE